jgi:hypothetical protein
MTWNTQDRVGKDANDGVGAAVVLFLLMVGLRMLYDFLATWRSQTFPYRLIMAFYYYGLFRGPIIWASLLGRIWNGASGVRQTIYPNLDFLVGKILAILSVLAYGVATVGPLILLGVAIRRLLVDRLGEKAVQWLLFTIAFGPAFLGLGWLTIASVVDWLFAAASAPPGVS